MFTLIIEDKHGGIADEYSFEEGEFYIGRSHNSDIILPSDNVSRRHARLYTADGRCYVEDLNSSNGVFVNGRRIHEVYQIQRSAQIKIGDYYLHIESDAEAVTEEDRTFCRLIGRNLAFANQVFRIQRKVSLVGRGKDCTITIIDPSVSRIHAKLTVERSGSLTLEDLKSSNGTFVNDDRIDIATLNHRDIVRFGNVEFLLEIPDAADRAPSRPSPAAMRERTGTSPGDRRFATVGVQPAYDDDWGAPRRQSPRNLWMVLSVVGAVLVLGAILVAIFHNELFGSSDPAKPGPVVQQPDTSVDHEAEERERKKKEILALIDMGNERVKNRQWDLALETWNQVVDRDPLNAEAQKAINQIKVWKRDKDLLDQARKLRIELKRGQAARLLREIAEASIYYEEARGELAQLVASKPTMLMNADNKLRQKDCRGALEELKEVQQVDPRDSTILDQIEAVEKKLGTRKCKD
ncbi:MAG: FHA domain-containing protein [Deltaproteobacteria bacterium]|nr:MAG: FHA domain-containing protein [Deltaproteobacteria bacterium]